MNCCFDSADILIPNCDLEKWACIACDQYTSEPEYWHDVETFVGDAPSAYNLILPECYLKTDNSAEIAKINGNMKKYLDAGVFKEYKNVMVFVERTDSTGAVRKGIVGKISLADYDYSVSSNSAVRATEKTVIERIPPRVAIRKDALLEMPHIMLLFDDIQNVVIKTVEESADSFPILYDFDLSFGGGHIKGRLIDEKTKTKIKSLLSQIADKNAGFLFGVGDGNHSLATAKECSKINDNPLSKYALCEIVNIHDASLNFEPIYRTVKCTDTDKLISEFKAFCENEIKGDNVHKFTCVSNHVETEITVCSKFNLPVATLQYFLDNSSFAKELEIDYIHGVQSLKKLSSKENTVGFLFEGMKKQDLFPAIVNNGSLPRKTFSMGHANDKRFYLEARRITL